MLVAPYPRSANSFTAVFNIRSRVISDGRFIFVPTPDFKLLFEIHYFYVGGKANTEKTFRRPHATEGERARKRRPQAAGQKVVHPLVRRRAPSLAKIKICCEK
jgi:hypothetical protein